MRNNFKGMLLMIAALGLFSCSDKLVEDSPTQTGGADGETGYLSFRIKSADTGGMTRADNETPWLSDNDDYHKGEDNVSEDKKFASEYEIVKNVQANRVFFFDKEGNYHSSALLTLDTEEGPHDATDEDHLADSEGGDSYAEAEVVYSTTVKRTGARGQENWPTQCLVVLNGRPSRLNALTIKAQEGTFATADGPLTEMDGLLAWVNKDWSDTDADEEGETLGLFKYNNLYYFTMTNSVYVGADGVIDATQIPEDKLFMTREEAADHPVVVFVERIMSKVEVGFVGFDLGEDISEDVEYFPNANHPLGFLYSFTDSKEKGVTWVNNDNDDANHDEKKVTLQALVTNWTINAVEYQTKLFKGIDKDWTEEKGPFDYWNDYSHHRSYWAIDPHYDFSEKEYPTQFRTAYPEGSVRPYQSDWSYGKSEEEKDGNDIFSLNYKWALDYKSFNAVVNKRRYKYCLENTFGLEDNDKEGYKHMIMGSHVLIQARLLTSDEVDANKGVTDEKNLQVADKYYYSDAYYNEEAYINGRVTNINQILEKNVDGTTVENLNMFDEDGDAIDGEQHKKFTFDNINGGLWIKAKAQKDGKDIYKKVVPTVEEGKEECQVAATDVFCIAPAYVAKGDGKVTIALKAEGENEVYAYNEVTSEKNTVNLYYVEENYVDNDGQPVDKDGNAVTPTQFTRNQLVSLIYGVAGVADCFKEGRMYYAVPIQHHLAGTGEDGDYEYKYTELNTADYGVVRNHWYKFTVNQILKPGIPVHNPDQPIIPNYDEEDRYIGLEIVILPWHIVNNGNVTLGQ